MLQKRHLKINLEKTEEYEIKRGDDEIWKQAKYLGTMLDTETDMKRRKQLANASLNKIKHITKDRKVKLSLKLRAYNAYVSSVFLYNSETWTLTKTRSSDIDVFHRKHLRNILNIRWPDVISNINLYAKTGEKVWTDTVEIRRLRFLGHILRLPTETPVRQALSEFCKKHKNPRGAPKTTWYKTVVKNLKDRGYTFEQALSLANERKSWRSLIVNCS